jgi:hypothetical protein
MLKYNIITIAVIFHTLATFASVSGGCLPTNWNYSWYNVGSAWFTVTKTAGTWSEGVANCKLIEHGRTSIASINDQNEQDHFIKAAITDNNIWLGGIRSEKLNWFWFMDNGVQSSLRSIKTTFWYDGQPDNYSGNQWCIHVYSAAYNREWNDRECHSKRVALCELRC